MQKLNLIIHLQSHLSVVTCRKSAINDFFQQSLIQFYHKAVAPPNNHRNRFLTMRVWQFWFVTFRPTGVVLLPVGYRLNIAFVAFFLVANVNDHSHRGSVKLGSGLSSNKIVILPSDYEIIVASFVGFETTIIEWDDV